MWIWGRKKIFAYLFKSRERGENILSSTSSKERERRCATALPPASDSGALAACIAGGNGRSCPSGLRSSRRSRILSVLPLWVLEEDWGEWAVGEGRYRRRHRRRQEGMRIEGRRRWHHHCGCWSRRRRPCLHSRKGSPFFFCFSYPFFYLYFFLLMHGWIVCEDGDQI